MEHARARRIAKGSNAGMMDAVGVVGHALQGNNANLAPVRAPVRPTASERNAVTTVAVGVAAPADRMLAASLVFASQSALRIVLENSVDRMVGAEHVGSVRRVRVVEQAVSARLTAFRIASERSVVPMGATGSVAFVVTARSVYSAASLAVRTTCSRFNHR